MDTSDCEEEYTIYVEFKDTVNIEKYKGIHIFGIDGKQPVIQLDDTFFAGKYENPLGSYMFFESDPTPKCTDTLFDKIPDKNLKYSCKTRKYLPMEHAYVAPKEGKENDLHNQQQELEDVIEPVNFKTLQEAIDTFKSSIITNKSITETNSENSNAMDCNS